MMFNLKFLLRVLSKIVDVDRLDNIIKRSYANNAENCKQIFRFAIETHSLVC